MPIRFQDNVNSCDGTKDSLKKLLDNCGKPIAYRPEFFKITRSVYAALFLSQAVYWHGKGRDKEGWFYKTRKEWESEIGLTRDQQESARKLLKELGCIDEKKQGLPARLFYRVVICEVERRIMEVYDIGGAQPTAEQKSDQAASRKVAVKEAEKSPTIQLVAEITTQTTPEKNPERGFTREWPMIQMQDGLYNIGARYVSSERIKHGLEEWLSFMKESPKGLPTVFAMENTFCNWWEKYTLEAIEHSVCAAASNKWRQIFEDNAIDFEKKNPPSIEEKVGLRMARIEKRIRMCREQEERETQNRQMDADAIDAEWAEVSDEAFIERR